MTGDIPFGEAEASLTAEVLREVLAGGADAFARLTSDEGAVDDFGFDPELTDDYLLPVLRMLYEKYFRVDLEGLEHVPADGERSWSPTTPAPCRWTP